VQRTLAVVLSAATSVAALGLAGCDEQPQAPSSERATVDTSPRPMSPAVAPLPPQDQLTDVLYRLADTSTPAEQKVGLVQYATADDQPALTNFGEALRDSGFVPLTVVATDLAWAGEPGHVVATVTIGSSNPQVRPFTYPMEFVPIRDTWQLSRRTAEQLLPLVAGAAASPTPPR
jgi:hypothetical protein